METLIFLHPSRLTPRICRMLINGSHEGRPKAGNGRYGRLRTFNLAGGSTRLRDFLARN